MGRWRSARLTRRQVLRVLPTGALMAGLLASCAAPSAPGQTEGPRVSTSSEPTPAARTGQAHNGGTLKAFFATQDPPTLDPYINSSFRGQTFAAFVYSRLLMSKKAP